MANNKIEQLTIPVASDRSALAIAEILAELTKVLAEKKVVSITVDGQPVLFNTLTGNANVMIDHDTMEMNDGRLSAKGLFAMETK